MKAFREIALLTILIFVTACDEVKMNGLGEESFSTLEATSRLSHFMVGGGLTLANQSMSLAPSK
jgi:hypothetical protein